MKTHFDEHVELHCHSNYSSRDGIRGPRDIVKYAHSQGMPAIAITDTGCTWAWSEEKRAAEQLSNIKPIYGCELEIVNDLDQTITNDLEGIKSTAPSFCATVLVKNNDGIKELYRIISNAEMKFKYKNGVRVPLSDLYYDSVSNRKKRENLLLGSGNERGILYKSVMEKCHPKMVEKIASYFDYIEVVPVENMLYMINEGCYCIEDVDELVNVNKQLVELGSKLSIPVVAISDAKYLLREDAEMELHFKSTKEMLELFSYLGEEKAREIVVDNSNMIADLCKDICLDVNERHYPVLENQEKRLRELCEKAICEKYPDNNGHVYERLDWEIQALVQTDMVGIVLQIKELLEQNDLHSYELSLRGTATDCLVLYLLGISDVDPIDFDLSPYFSFGFEGTKQLDIAINVPSEMKTKIMDTICKLEGVGQAVRVGNVPYIGEENAFVTNQGMDVHPDGMILIPDGFDYSEVFPIEICENNQMVAAKEYRDFKDSLYRLDIIEHDSVQLLHNLFAKTEVDPREIDLHDSQIASLFTNTTELGYKQGGMLGNTIGLLGIDNSILSFLQELSIKTNVSSIEDLIRTLGLLHGTGTWFGNGEKLLEEETATLSELITSREDIYNYLLGFGIDKSVAFKVAEQVGKGKKLESDFSMLLLLREKGVPEWYIDSCNKIRYLFPKGHCISYALMMWRLAYFKLYYPKEFYEEYFKIKNEDILFLEETSDRYNSVLSYVKDRLSCLEYKGFFEELAELMVAVEMVKREKVNSKQN